MTHRLSGIIPPLPTPFTDAGDVDRRALAGNVTKLLTTDLAGVLALGSNGEAALLEDDECDVVVETVREVVPSSRLLLVGTGRESTQATIAAGKRAAARGADAVLVRTPSYFKTQLTPAALIAHFTAVADASPVPVLLYNLPGVTGISLTVPVVAALAEHPNVVGLKETSSDLERMGQFAAIRPDTFRVFCGWAPVIYPALVSGVAGGILAVANVVPELCTAIFRHVRAGRHEDALALQRQITPLAQLVTSVHGVPGLKAALDRTGYIGGHVRAPLLPASARAIDEIVQAIAVLDHIASASQVSR
jgi:4-hydroxy-2-oxoglutarate aldolase